MKKNRLTLLFTIVTLFFISCSNDEFEDVVKKPLADNISTSIIKFSYNGISYVSDYKILADSIILFNNEEVHDLYYLLQSNEELATYVHPNGDIEFFDSFEALQNCYKPIEDSNYLRNTAVASKLVLYEHDSYRGQSYLVEGNKEVSWLADFNDRASSFELITNKSFAFVNYNVTFYKDINFKGSTLSFSVKKGYQRGEIYLGIFRMGLWGMGKSWNDSVTSLKTWSYSGF